MTNLSELPFVTTADLIDRWMVAWHGGTVLRDYLSRRRAGVDADDQYLPYWAGKLADGGTIHTGYNRYADYHHVTTLPEAALDWPVYRAALAPVDDGPVADGSGFAPQGYYDPVTMPDGSVVDFDDPRWCGDREPHERHYTDGIECPGTPGETA